MRDARAVQKEEVLVSGWYGMVRWCLRWFRMSVSASSLVFVLVPLGTG